MATFGIALAFQTAARAQDASALLGDMSPFTRYTIEVLEDPNSIMSDLLPRAPLDVDPSGVGYRLFIASGFDPVRLHADVCPGGYETTWYSVWSDRGTPLMLSFVAEVESEAVGLASWFSPISSGMYRVDSPAHIAFCSFSDTRGEYRRSHSLTVAQAGTGSSSNVTCAIRVNNSGRISVLDEAAGSISADCFGER